MLLPVACCTICVPLWLWEPRWASVDKITPDVSFQQWWLWSGVKLVEQIPSSLLTSMWKNVTYQMLLWIERLISSKDVFSLLARQECHCSQVVEARRFWGGWTSIGQASAFSSCWVSGLCSSGKIEAQHLNLQNWHQVELHIKGTYVLVVAILPASRLW